MRTEHSDDELPAVDTDGKKTAAKIAGAIRELGIMQHDLEEEMDRLKVKIEAIEHDIKDTESKVKAEENTLHEVNIEQFKKIETRIPSMAREARPGRKGEDVKSKIYKQFIEAVEEYTEKMDLY